MLEKLRRKKQDDDPARELVLKINRFSNEAYGAGKAFTTKSLSEPELEQQAKELAAVLPELALLAKSLPEALRPDIERTLSEANLDISFVLAGGKAPSSIRLGRFRQEMEQTGG